MTSSLSSQELFIPVNTRKTFVASRTRPFVSAKTFCINLTSEYADGNPSAIEGQTGKIKYLRTGLWA